MITEVDAAIQDYAVDHHQQPRFAGDAHLFVTFFTYPVQNMEKTHEMGRPIFEEREFIRIMTPGNKKTVVVREARDPDRMRFDKQYSSFKANEEEVLEGTPLSAWPIISRAQVEELKHFNIRTVEHLAELSDVHASAHMGLVSLKLKAQDFLAAAADLAPMEHLRTAMEEKDNEIATLTSALEDLMAKVQKLEANSED